MSRFPWLYFSGGMVLETNLKEVVSAITGMHKFETATEGISITNGATAMALSAAKSLGK